MHTIKSMHEHISSTHSPMEVLLAACEDTTHVCIEYMHEHIPSTHSPMEVYTIGCMRGHHTCMHTIKSMHEHIPSTHSPMEVLLAASKVCLYVRAALLVTREVAALLKANTSMV